MSILTENDAAPQPIDIDRSSTHVIRFISRPRACGGRVASGGTRSRGGGAARRSGLGLGRAGRTRGPTQRGSRARAGGVPFSVCVPSGQIPGLRFPLPTSVSIAHDSRPRLGFRARSYTVPRSIDKLRYSPPPAASRSSASSSLISIIALTSSSRAALVARSSALSESALASATSMFVVRIACSIDEPPSLCS